MSIKKKDNLYNLIKSLTKNEKKFFREFLKSGKDGNLHLLLFNIIDKQSKYKKEEIIKAFDNKANQLPVIKTYLQKQIQNALNIYHSQASNFDRTLNSFLFIGQLLDRELLDLAEGEIEKILKNLRAANQPMLLLQALELQKQLLLKKYGPTAEEIKKILNEILQEQNKTLETLFNLHQLEELQANFFDHFQQGSGLSPVIYTDLNKNPLITDDNKALSLKAKLLQADITYRMHIFRNRNFASAEEAIQKGIRLMEVAPESIANMPEEYLRMLNQKLELLIQTKNIPEIFDTLQKIRQAPRDYNFDIKTPHLRRVVMEAYALELEIYGQSNDHKRAQLLIDKIDAEYSELLSPALRQWRTVMDYEIGKYYLNRGQTDLAEKRLKNISRAEHSIRERDTLLSSYFLRAQIALKRKNNLELKKISADLQNFFKNERKAARLEKHLLNLLISWPDLFPFQRRHRKLVRLFNKVQTAATAKPDHALADFVEWLHSWLFEELQR